MLYGLSKSNTVFPDVLFDRSVLYRLSQFFLLLDHSLDSFGGFGIFLYGNLDSHESKVTEDILISWSWDSYNFESVKKLRKFRSFLLNSKRSKSLYVDLFLHHLSESPDIPAVVDFFVHSLKY